MTDEAALLAAILADPGEDLHRLAYADWLDENPTVICPECEGGNPQRNVREDGGRWVWDCPVCNGGKSAPDSRADRAAFIRAQCWLAAHPSCGSCTGNQWAAGEYCPECREREPHRRQVEKLMTDDNRAAWFAVPGLGVQLEGDGSTLFWWVQPNGPRIEAAVSRGFVSAVTADFTPLFGTPCEFCSGLGHFQTSGSCSECPRCRGPRGLGTGRVGCVAGALFARHPIGRVDLTDLPIHKSGGNDTYFVGGLGRFPRAYWSSLDGLSSPRAAEAARSAAACEWGRRLAFC
jgi:hypothetical protein